MPLWWQRDNKATIGSLVITDLTVHCDMKILLEVGLKHYVIITVYWRLTDFQIKATYAIVFAFAFFTYSCGLRNWLGEFHPYACQSRFALDCQLSMNWDYLTFKILINSLTSSIWKQHHSIITN